MRISSRFFASFYTYFGPGVHAEEKFRKRYCVAVRHQLPGKDQVCK